MASVGTPASSSRYYCDCPRARLNHRSSGIIGAAIALAGIALIIGIEVPLILRSQRRRQEEKLRSLPNGAFHACRGSTVMPGHRALVTGNMILDQQGITFTPLRDNSAPLMILWFEVARIQLGRARSQPLAGSLVLNKSDGTKAPSSSGHGVVLLRCWPRRRAMSFDLSHECRPGRSPYGLQAHNVGGCASRVGCASATSHQGGVADHG